MASDAYSDALSAWQGLCRDAGLDLDDRDEDLLTLLKDAIDPGAPDLNSALTGTSVGVFVQALFQTVQPFVGMFRDA